MEGNADGNPLVGVDLAGWFEANGRDLPWRRTRDPWAILVAEAMLQQTQVARVTERWPRFLRRFPTPSICAAAPVGDVIDEWAGLGYNRRAVALHRAATAVVERHDGHVPEGLADLLALPGVGPYTARAVRVFALELDDAVVDTNVARILARVGGRSLRPAPVQALADGAVPRGRGWLWNQALLDVGAGWCTARAPRCADGCPVAAAGRCAWWAAGRPEPDPAVGSARVSGGQSRFDGSDRQGRGRLVDALRRGPVPVAELPFIMGWPDDATRAERVAATVVTDGLARRRGETLTLGG
ncbi:MAG: A/G-specific adenine glycosylase [Acidimicrobiia bacterium]|nr:A/G-specific adenine glycosylase [Acidimicrobiia bacterium]MDH5288404.1 A/G-specific adenine glycosylase [Acidimicrobiia bacterium]